VGGILRTNQRLLIAIATFGALVATFTSKVFDFDVWFHLTVGREIARTGAIPASEFYVYPVLGAPAQLNEWGFSLVTHAIHETLGWWGLAIFNAVLGALAVVLLILAARRRGAHVSTSLALAAPLVFLMAFRVQYRPESFLFVALAAAVLVLEFAETDRRWLLLLPAITCAQSLFHPSALVVLFVVGCRSIDLVVRARNDGAARRMAAWTGGALFASAGMVVLLPFGVDQLMKPFAMAEGGLAPQLRELLPSLQTTFAPHVIGIAVAAAASLCVTRRRISDVFLVLVLGFLAFRYVRGIPLFAMAAYPIAAEALDRYARHLSRRARAAAAAGALSAVTLSSVLAPTWGAGPAFGQFPQGTAEFIEQHRPRGHLVNELHTGGFLAWNLFPEYLVSIDGHFWSTNEAFRFTDGILEMAPGWEDEVRTRGVTMIATSGSAFNGALMPIVSALDGDPAWNLVVREPAGLLFLRTDVAGELGITPLPKTAIWYQIIEETGRAIEWNGAGAPARFSRGVAYFKLHDFARAADEFDRYAREVPSDGEAAQIAALLRASVAGDAAATQQLDAIYAAGRGAG
jgi:hypothetical protein